MKVNEEIEELIKIKEQNNVLSERLTYLDQKLQKLTIKEKAFEARTEEELEDVKRLEELGLRSLFKKVMGDLDKALEKERKEYLAAVLAHQAVEEEIKILEFEKELLNKKYRDPALIEKDLAALIKKKQFLLKSHDSTFSKELFKRESELGRYKLLDQKSNGVLKSAEKTIKIINEIRSELLKVKDWPPSGKGKYSSVAKKKYIDRARSKAVQAKVRLEEFGEITNKLFKEINLVFKLGTFDDFLDAFIDNLITDYVIQEKLELSLSQLEHILNDLEDTSKTVSSERKNYEEAILERQAAMEEYVRDYNKIAGT